jgi:hypothetical protein
MNVPLIDQLNEWAQMLRTVHTYFSQDTLDKVIIEIERKVKEMREEDK